MVIGFRSLASNPTNWDSKRTSITVPKPAGAVVGDLIHVTIWLFNNGTTTSPTITVPSGWTATEVAFGATSENWMNRNVVLTKPYSGESSWTFSHSTGWSGGHAIAFTGVDLANPLDAATVNNISGNFPAATVTGPTTVTDGAWLVSSRQGWDGLETSPSAGWTERYDDGDRIDTQVRPTAGPTGTLSVPHGNSSNSNPWGLIVVALRPAGDDPEPEPIEVGAPVPVTVDITTDTSRGLTAGADPALAVDASADMRRARATQAGLPLEVDLAADTVRGRTTAADQALVVDLSADLDRQLGLGTHLGFTLDITADITVATVGTLDADVPLAVAVTADTARGVATDADRAIGVDIGAGTERGLTAGVDLPLGVGITVDLIHRQAGAVSASVDLGVDIGAGLQRSTRPEADRALTVDIEADTARGLGAQSDQHLGVNITTGAARGRSVGGGLEFTLNITVDISDKVPPRDLRILAIEDRSRATTVTDRSRTTTVEPRLRRTTITDRSA